MSNKVNKKESFINVNQNTISPPLGVLTNLSTVIHMTGEMNFHYLNGSNEPSNIGRLITSTSLHFPRMDLLVVERVAQKRYIKRTR